MPRIPETELERLKNDVSVQRLVEASGVELRRAGKDWMGRCPLHEDETASLVVTPAKNLWNCFGCGEGGGPIDWVMKRRGVSFRHAVELLREGVVPLAAEGMVLHNPRLRALPAPVALDADDQALLNQTVTYYHERLLATSEAQTYLAVRGLDHPELIGHFKLGLADRTLGLRLPEKTRKAGAEKVGSAHLLRHACATHMLEGGADIRFIQEMLGHANIETTQIYTHVSIDKLLAVHRATHPSRLQRHRGEAGEAPGASNGPVSGPVSGPSLDEARERAAQALLSAIATEGEDGEGSEDGDCAPVKA